MGQIVNSVVLEKGLRAEFVRAFNAVTGKKFEKALMKVGSGAGSEKYGWLGSAPVMQEWKDRRVVKGLLDQAYELPNIPFEATLGVDRFALEDDQLGATKVRIADLAQRARLFPLKLFMERLVAGTTNLCYDGQPYFSASHSEGKSGVQSNIVTGTGITTAQVSADFKTGRAALQGFKDDQGEPFNEGDLDLLVIAGPGIYATLEEVLAGTINVSGATNVLKNAADFMGSARIADNDWYMMDVSGGLKPMILQERTPVEFQPMEGNSEQGFSERLFKYGVHWRGNVGYGLWQKAVKVNNS